MLPGALTRTKRKWAVLLVACIVLGACSGSTKTSGTSRGVVVSVEGSFEDITGFTVLVEGEEVRYVPVEDGDYAFPLPHLREHQRNGDPVLVGWELREDVHYALSLDDG